MVVTAASYSRSSAKFVRSPALPVPLQRWAMVGYVPGAMLRGGAIAAWCRTGGGSVEAVFGHVSPLYPVASHI